jgi:hypothetical protein
MNDALPAILSPAQARDAFARIAESQLGVREHGGNNCGPEIRKYQKSTWLTPDAWAWCAAFVCWCMEQWLSSPSVLAVLKMSETSASAFRPRTAGAWDLIRWAKDNGLTVVNQNEPARRGDICVFDFGGHGHTGIVAEDSDRGEVATVDGNTNGRGERDSESGDGVWLKHRDREDVKAFIRLV